MALTKVSRGLLSTGIVDNSNATAITLNADESATFAGAISVIGTATASEMTVADTDDIRLRFLNGTTFKAGLQVATSTDDMIAGSAVDDLAIRAQTNMLFATGGNTEAMRLSGGNLLVGKTALEYENTAGHIFRNDGLQSSIRSGGNVADFNRLSSDGEIIRFSKDGTTVGSIGTGSSLLTIGTGTGNLVFGNALVAPCSDSSVGSSNGVVNLGATNRRFKDLHMSGKAYMTGLEPGQVTITQGSYFIGNVPAGYRFNNAADTVNLMILKDNGDLSVGTSGSGHRLFLANAINATQSNAQFRILGSGYSAFHFLDANAYYIGQNSNSRSFRLYSGANTGVGAQLSAGATSFGTFSDERLKENIEPIENALTSLSRLQTVKYHLKDVDSAESKKRLGLIAQDLVGVLDEVIEPITRAEDDTEYMAVRYTEIIPVLVKAMQEQQATIELQAAVITDLTTRLTALENN